ncbi:CDN_1a_G0017650.mRNA.1.CDS.1 [Saccharomyces cerevisiae]|nr:CDN_1a_G0017650.mRNA.1.CDS.1 [Saccharomyces cerevisiae]CAI7280982.1 CDN_1a_G0017650.mRNA.1.CDS.1 [Saccharomyces cerevisiae]
MIVNNTHILTLPLSLPPPHATLTFTCILIWHTHTDATVYTTLNLPYSHIPLPFSLNQC